MAATINQNAVGCAAHVRADIESSDMANTGRNEPVLIQRKLRLFGHISRMEDNRKLKTLMFGIVDGTNKRGRPCREWMDDIVSWCKTGQQELNSLAQDRRRWKHITRQAMVGPTPTGAGPMVPEEDELVSAQAN